MQSKLAYNCVAHFFRAIRAGTVHRRHEALRAKLLAVLVWRFSHSIRKDQ
jgi:hypothetical protein